MAEKYKDKLRIITISSDDNVKVMNDYLKRNNPNWTFLHIGNEPELLKQYDIRAYPTYFLIDRQGKLIFSPAASPAESFELFLFQAMRQRGDI